MNHFIKGAAHVAKSVGRGVVKGVVGAGVITGAALIAMAEVVEEEARVKAAITNVLEQLESEHEHRKRCSICKLPFNRFFGASCLIGEAFHGASVEAIKEYERVSEEQPDLVCRLLAKRDKDERRLLTNLIFIAKWKRA